MNRANPADLRAAMVLANTMVKAGLLFVPMPVSSVAEFNEQTFVALDRLDKLTEAAEVTEKGETT